MANDHHGIDMIATIEDVCRWAELIQRPELARELFTPAYIYQMVAVLQADQAANTRRLDAMDRKEAETDRRLAEIEAMYEAISTAQDALDIFRAGYERGYAKGWEHAKADETEIPPDWDEDHEPRTP